MDPAPPLPDYDEALARVLGKVDVLGTEVLPVTAAMGRVLREGITADRDQPPFHRSAMDGFAVRSAEVAPGAVFAVTGSIAAGEPFAESVDDAGEVPGVVRIATGAAVPPVFDAVIPIEQAEATSDRGGGSVRFNIDAVEPGRCIHPRGADARRGDTVLPSGTPLGPHHLGIAAAVGAAEVAVSRRPAVSILSTGDEVQPIARPTDCLAPQQIRNSNAPMLCGLVERWGGELMDLVHVPDEPEVTLAAAREALSKSNLVLTTGGVSVGARDYLPGVWKRLGLRVILHGVNVQPGKPLFVAQAVDEHEKLVVGLPGNPVSVLATAHLFVSAVMRTMNGAAEPGLLWRRVWLAEEARPNPRRESFRPCRFVGETREQVVVIPWQGSGDLMHTAAADGLLRLPIQREPVPAGSPLPMLPWLDG